LPRDFSTGEIVLMRWRTGRKIGKNIYAMVGDEPSDEDIDIGRMDHEEIAAIAVLNHNNSLGHIDMEAVAWMKDGELGLGPAENGEEVLWRMRQGKRQ